MSQNPASAGRPASAPATTVPGGEGREAQRAAITASVMARSAAASAKAASASMATGSSIAAMGSRAAACFSISLSSARNSDGDRGGKDSNASGAGRPMVLASRTAASRVASRAATSARVSAKKASAAKPTGSSMPENRSVVLDTSAMTSSRAANSPGASISSGRGPGPTGSADQPAAKMASWVAVSAAVSAKDAWAASATGSSADSKAPLSGACLAMIESSAARASGVNWFSTGTASGEISGGGSVLEATVCASQPAARMASWVALSALISAKAASAASATGSSTAGKFMSSPSVRSTTASRASSAAAGIRSSSGASGGAGTTSADQPAAEMASWAAFSAFSSEKAASASMATGSSISRESSFFSLGSAFWIDVIQPSSWSSGKRRLLVVLTKDRFRIIPRSDDNDP